MSNAVRCGQHNHDTYCFIVYVHYVALRGKLPMGIVHGT